MKIKSIISTFVIIFILLTASIKSSFGFTDVGVTAIIHPVCPVIPGIPDSIVIVVTNFGTDTMTGIDVGFSLSGTMPVIETWVGSLPPFSSDTFTFTTTIVFPVGIFTLCSFTMPGDIDPSNDSTCVLCSSTPMSLHENQTFITKNLSVYPNPTSGKFLIKFEDSISNDSSIEITDTRGGIIWSSYALKKEFYVDITDEPNGVYVINLKTEKYNSTSKLLMYK